MRRRQAELGFDGGAEQRPAELVEALALHDEPGRRSLEGLHVGHRDAHVFEPQRLQRLEAEHVADQAGGQVGDRALLEQDQIVGDPGEVLARVVRHRLDPVGLGAVAVAGGQPIGPDHRPGRGADDSPATAAAASIGSTPSCGVIRNRHRTSVSLGT